MTGDNLTHEQIWDDSALQESWEDALTEYKKYHSLAAKGEQVDLSQLNDNEGVKKESETLAIVPQQPAKSNGTATEPSQTTTGAQPEIEPPTAAPSGHSTNVQPAAAPAAQHGAGAMPQAILNSMQDEGMKNLMMSWYYAGYYTGLLEGQQKAYASMQETA